MMAKLNANDRFPIYYGASPELMRVAADLRYSMTKAERLLWEKIRNRKLCGFKFRRHHPISEIRRLKTTSFQLWQKLKVI
jgi:very-short-patch-repair endonuclease